jgi:hypothetical protein
MGLRPKKPGAKLPPNPRRGAEAKARVAAAQKVRQRKVLKPGNWVIGLKQRIKIATGEFVRANLLLSYRLGVQAVLWFVKTADNRPGHLPESSFAVYSTEEQRGEGGQKPQRVGARTRIADPTQPPRATQRSLAPKRPNVPPGANPRGSADSRPLKYVFRT